MLLPRQVNKSQNLKPLSWKMIFKLMLKVFLMNKFNTLLLVSYDVILRSWKSQLKTIQKAKLQAHYSNLNKFRVRLATKKEASLAMLPPCEATFHQHVLRASLQTYIWKSSQKAQSPVRSPLMFGWEDKGGLVPVFFRGQMSSDFLQDLVCSCKGKSICSSSCVCFE